MADRAALHSLLDRFDDAQRKDIQDLTKGHLNENKLWKSTVEERKRSVWSSAKKEALWMRKRVDVKKNSICNKKLPPLIKNRGDSALQRHTAFTGVTSSLEKLPSLEIGSETSPNEFSTTLRSKEPFYPETMVPTYSERVPFSKEFIPSHLMFPTKEEQYKQFKKTDKQLLSTSDTSYNFQLKKDLCNIDEKMKQKLKLLESKEDVSFPNYYKLMIFNETWEEIIKILGKEGEKLKAIKIDYDAYVNALLEEQIHLCEQFPQQDYSNLFDREAADESEIIEEEEHRLRKLEDQLLDELKENERLRKLLKDSLKDDPNLLLQLKKEEKNDGLVDSKSFPCDLKTEDNTDDLEIQVMTLHAQIEEQYQELKKIRKKQRGNYVPHVVCQRLEQCIKEAEVDIHRVSKQNDFLEHDIQALEEQLENVLVRTGFKEKDGRLLWRKVSVSQLLHL